MRDEALKPQLISMPDFAYDLVNFRALPALKYKCYRSASLHHFSTVGLVHICSLLAISDWIDFRTDAEIDVDRLHQLLDKTGLRHHHVPINTRRIPLPEIAFRTPEFYALHYLEMLEHAKYSFAHFFQLMSGSIQLPMVISCNFGKDRTGLAVYLLLNLLDIPFQDIRTDFLANNAGLIASANVFENHWRKRGIEKEAYISGILVNAKSVEVFHERFVEKYHSASDYLQHHLCLDVAIIQSIQHKFTRES